MQHLPITASRPLRPAKATDLAPAVSPAAFQATENTSLVHARSGSTPISQPAVLNVPPDQLSFTGPYFLLPHIGLAPPAFPRQTLAPDLTLTRLSNVICLPGQIALAPAGGEHTLLMESLSNEWQRDSIHIDKTDDHTFSLREPIGPVEQLPGRYLYLCNMHSPHFGHFLVDVLSMCWGFQAARALGIELRVLVERHLPGYLAPLLEACGIPPSAITPVTRPLSCAEVFFATRSFFHPGLDHARRDGDLAANPATRWTKAKARKRSTSRAAMSATGLCSTKAKSRPAFAGAASSSPTPSNSPSGTK